MVYSLGGLKETWFINNEFHKEFNDQYFLDFFDPILTKKNHNQIIPLPKLLPVVQSIFNLSPPSTYSSLLLLFH